MATATITFDASDYASTDFDPRRTKVYATNNVPGGAVIDVLGNHIYLGSGSGTINADGTGEITVPAVGTGYNPESWQTTIHIDYADKNTARGRDVKSFGPFTITEDAQLAELIDEMPVQPEYASEVFTRLDALEAAVGEGGDTIVIGDGGALIVSSGGTINLNESLANGALVGYRFTGSATVEGIVLAAGSYVFERDTASPSGWTYRSIAEGADLPLPDTGGGEPGADVEVTPQQPTWNDSLRTYTIANTTGVQYKKGGVNIAAGTYSTDSPTAAETVTITASPKTGYVFPTGVATSWSHNYPLVTTWTESFNDTLLTPVGTVESRSGWLFPNAGTAGDISIDATKGLALRQETLAMKMNPVETLKHFIQFDYDLSEADTGYDRFYVDIARAYQPHRHILSRFSSGAVQLETWYENTLAGGTKFITTLPLSGTFRAESDGLYAYAYVNGTKIAEGPHDGSLLGGGQPIASTFNARGQGVNNTKSYTKNLIMGTKA